MSDNEGSSSPPADVKSDRAGSEDLDTAPTRKRARPVDPDEEDEDIDNNVSGKAGGKGGTNGEDEEGEEGGNAEEADEEDDEDEDEEDEEEEEEDEGGREDGGRRKKRRRKQNRYRFLDVEAEVDDEDEEEDEGDDYGDVAEFIDEVPDEAGAQNDYEHRRLDRSFGRKEEESVEDIVKKLKERHGRQATQRYDADSDNIPQRLLMPGVNDPSLWRIKVRPGREQSITASIFRKVFSQQYSANPIEVLSVFYRDSIPGSIFIEATQSAAALQAVHGILNVFMSTKPALVPIEEMAPLLRIKKKEVSLVPGMWVRIKRGRYNGDLAQVVDVDQITSGVAGIKFLPRIDLAPREKKKDRVGGRTLGSSMKPQAQPFNYDEVRKVYGRSSVRQGVQGSYIFDGDEFIDGFCIKDVKIALIETEDVKPTLEEISKFSGDDQTASKIDLSTIADANRSTTASGLVPGDKVEVHEGEQTGLYGLVVTVTPEVIAIQAEGGEIHGQVIEVPARSVRKRFEVGEHVTILNGKNMHTSGMVVEMKGDVVTLMSDQGEREIKVFSKDIRKAGDTAGAPQNAGLYDLHDMVMLDSTTAGVIIKIEGSILRILDQNGGLRILNPQQVTARRDNKNFAVATDSQGNEMRVGDAMKEVAGENRQGEIINIFRSLFVFLHNRELTENNGVFIARAAQLVSVTPKSATGDLGKLNPALNAQLPMGGAMLMPPPATSINKGRMVNTLVVVTKGSNKGLMGVIKDVQGDSARVELATNNKILTINLGFLKRKDPKTGQTYALDTAGFGSYNGGAGGRPAAGGYDVNPYTGAPMNGGQTPALGGRTPAARFGQTPNPYATGAYGGGKTPNPYAAGGGGRTPAPGTWGGSGGKTPGWAGSGGKTPGWAGAGGAGGRTPAPGFADGGKTPGWAGAGAGGGRTPNPYAAGPSGGRTPAPPGAMYADPGSSRYGQGALHGAPTPYGGPTPGIQGAPTPAPIGGVNPYTAPTPYGAPTPFTAPTPFAAPTPGAALSAPTPGVTGATPYGAPTPYGAAPTPYGGPTNGTVPSAGGIPWDWALDFRNVLVEVGPSTKLGTRAPLHFQRGAVDGRRFGVEDVTPDELVKCVSLDDGAIEEIPAEYLRPVKPDGPGQLCICVVGESKGAQRTTQYENDGQWMMEPEVDDMGAMVMDGAGLCRLWRT